jgi:signal transduction histidine kinase
MKIFGGKSGVPGRWRIALPPLLLIAFLIALFILAAAGQSRLYKADDQVRRLQLQGQALDDLLADAAGAAGAPDTTRLDRERLEVLRREQRAALTAATARSAADLRLSRWITACGAVLNIALVLLATALVYGDLRRRGRQAADLRDQKQALSRQVNERTSELTALSTHLQGVSEQEKSALSRELHDELGGLLVAARMDLSWLQQRLPTTDPAIEQRFKRIHESLSAGVDLKRRVVEELRPTLLDNMGLFAALRWQFRESCRRAGLNCTETIPELELKFNPDAAIGVFRVAQEAMTNILKHSSARSADICVHIGADEFVLEISDDGRGMTADRIDTNPSHGIASMRHRISALGGTWEVGPPAGGGTRVTARIPLVRVLA